MPTTPNYGWDTPADTDYVTNGALAIRTMANDADATVYSVQNTLDSTKVNKAGDTMTGALVVPSIIGSGRAVAFLEDGNNDAVLQILDATGTVQKGYLRVNADNFAELYVSSNGNNLSINNTGETIRGHAGNNRPLPFAMETGSVTVNANSDVTVSLTSGRFTQNPLVMVTCFSNSVAAITYHVGTRTTTNFKLFNTSAYDRTFMWQAIQMRSSSAVG